MPKKETRKFKHEKTTTHTQVFTEAPPPGTATIVGAIYVQKWFAGFAGDREGNHGHD